MKIPQMRCFSYRSVLWIIFLLFAAFLFPTHVSAQQAQRTTSGPTILKVNLGFEGLYQDGKWVPVQIDLSNNGSDFNGKVTVSIPTMSLNGGGSGTSNNTYQEAIDLPAGSQKQVTILVPLNLTLQGSTAQVSINLVDNANHIVVHKALTPGTSNSNLTLIGVLSDTPNNFSQLNLALSGLVSTAGQVKSLTAATFPSQAQVLQNFNVLVIDNFTTSTLNQQQFSALQSWVNQGGTLIITGGPEWKRTLGNLPDSLLPVIGKNNGTLPGGTQLLPINDLTKSNQSVTATLNTAVPIGSTQIAVGSSILLGSGTIPIIAQKRLGAGASYFLAYDPTIEPLASWSQTSQIWSSILVRALADDIITPTSTSTSTTNIPGNPGNTQVMPWQNASYDTSTIVNFLQSFFSNTFPSIWLILILLISYILILGPIRLLIVRIFKRRNWTWRIVLGTIVAFTLLSYGLALQQKGSAIVSSSISIVQLHSPDTTGTDGQVTTFLGIFVPNQGDFQVHMPDASLVEPADSAEGSYTGPSANNQQSTISVNGDSTDVDLQGVNIWTTRTLIAQHDIHTVGAITSQLQLQQNIVSGTVSSSLPYTLSDAFVVMGNSYLSIGDLSANSSKHVTINLDSSTTTGTNNPSIANQIALSRGIGHIDNSNGNSKDTARNHALMLEAMSGDYCNSNNSCYNQGPQVVTNNGTVIKYLNGNAINKHDPLVLPGAAATIIGWAQSPLLQSGDITVNGQSANNAPEMLVQAPLNITMAGNVHIPSGLIDSQIVHLQQSAAGDIQETTPNTYILATGNMTFEYSLPTNAALKNSTLTFTSSANPNIVAQPNVNPTGTINNLQALLYNWQTSKWDTVNFNKFSCSVNNAQAYIGPGNRLLLHLSNQNSTAIFDKPSLEVQGTVSN